MADALLRVAEGCDDDPFLLWDTRWNVAAGAGDWQLAGAEERLNRGGLASTQTLSTAVILCLFSDARVPDAHPLAWLADGDPRGWWGNGVDVRADEGEVELGSLLWLLERAPLTVGGISVAMWAEQLAREALAPLLQQGVVVLVEVEAEAVELKNRLDLVVRLYGSDGARVFDRKFESIWRQIGG